MPSAAQEWEYYVFYWTKSTPENGVPAQALTWARVDGRLRGGLGDVVEKGRVLTRSVRRAQLTAVRHTNRRDYWILTRGLDGRELLAFRLGPQGFRAEPVRSPVSGLDEAGGELKAAPNGRRLVSGGWVAAAGGGVSPNICLYDFDPATGAASNELRLPRRAGGQYSFSFSPNSRLLYATEYAGPSQNTLRMNELYQYDVSQPTAAAIEATRYRVSRVEAVPTPAATSPISDYVNCVGLQLAPDSTLWLSSVYLRAVTDPITGLIPLNSAGIVRHPNVAGPGCQLEPEAYPYLQDVLPSWNLPNVITNMLYAGPGLNYEVGCGEDSVRFWASSAGLGTGLRWDFGEPGSGAANTATGRWVAHRYTRSGRYLVRLTLADGRQLTQTVDVPAQAEDFTQQNIFTPNGDGLNDWFEPVRGSGLAQGRLRVYARWGQQVADAAGPLPRWDGAGAAGGVYFYLLEYTDCQGQPRQRRGTITLMR
ncbi:gliding motility-associated C-terminal domain-containing protein [Hymenobacter aranciens]|uniref:T9SS type B sorting domain-containing protein n=1 Tax=Hymenobacter aranciens TaxID=3063996 RepID=UPI00272B10BD|nr:gliding motility-associated C-terminal domain-containing protein [Hymenobacter sp. ASUV-10]